MKMKFRTGLLSLAGVLAVAVSAGSASAVSYTLNMGNAAISGYTGPYGTVDVTLVDSTHATITFTADAVGGNQYLFGDGSSVAVNVNATTWTLGTVSGTAVGTGFSPGPYSNGGSGNVDGWGVFNQTINSFDGFGDTAGVVSFTLTDVSGTWASDTDVLVANSDGHSVAAHIFVTSYPADAKNGALATGYAANGPSGVPDGGTTALFLGAAVSALGLIRRKLS